MVLTEDRNLELNGADTGQSTLGGMALTGAVYLEFNGADSGQPTYSQETLSLCHFFHHKYQ
jgi:hypothetical protein